LKVPERRGEGSLDGLESRSAQRFGTSAVPPRDDMRSDGEPNRKFDDRADGVASLWMTMREVEVALRLSRSTIYKQLIKTGKLRPKYLGRSLRFLRRDVEAFADGQ